MSKHNSSRVLISFDWVLKRLLRQKANYVILEGFLTELLGFEVRVKSLLESESNKEAENDLKYLSLVFKIFAVRRRKAFDYSSILYTV